MTSNIFSDISSFENNMEYKKNIFCYWDSGRTNLTDVMNISLRVVEKINPDYNFIFLDDENINNYFPYKNEIYEKSTIELTSQLFSDLLRIYLISKYGGIWIDCSVFFSKSFKHVEQLFNDYNLDWFSFFLFGGKNMACHSLISSFMVSKNNNKQLMKLFISLYEFITKPRDTKLEMIFYKSNNTVFLNTVFELEKINKYPYFILHYILNEIIKNNEINISNILLCNSIIESENTNFFGYIGFNKYNKNLYKEQILDNKGNIVEELLNKSNIQEYKKKIIKHVLIENNSIM